jgi:hypothetical protein
MVKLLGGAVTTAKCATSTPNYRRRQTTRAQIVHRIEECMAQKMVQKTISIPNDLNKRMDRIRDDVNWSAIAAQAWMRSGPFPEIIHSTRSG